MIKRSERRAECEERYCTDQATFGSKIVRSPTIIDPTDAIIRLPATCVCGSDLWPYRGLQPLSGPTPMGHEYCGFVEEVGSAVKIRQTGTICSRLVRNIGQHLSSLSVRLPVVVRAS